MYTANRRLIDHFALSAFISSHFASPCCFLFFNWYFFCLLAIYCPIYMCVFLVCVCKKEREKERAAFAMDALNKLTKCLVADEHVGDK